MSSSWKSTGKGTETRKYIVCWELNVWVDFRTGFMLGSSGTQINRGS